MNYHPQKQESLAQYVKRLRISMGMSQRQLAFKANIDVKSIGRLERGKTTRLHSKNQSKLASALHIPLDYLKGSLYCYYGESLLNKN